MADEELDPQIGRRLHARLMSGDLRASAEVAEMFLPWLCRRMHQLFPEVNDQHLVDTASIDAVRTYLKTPLSYQAEKLPLHKYLLMSAKGDLGNALAQSKRIAERKEEIARILVELDLGTAEQTIDTNELERLVEPFLPDPMDRQIFSLMASGINSTENHAVLLGITGQPVERQRKEVKARKDRIMARLRRAAQDGRLKLNR